MDLFCLKCNTSKAPEEFGNDRARPSGKYPYCKICVKNINTANYVKHGAKIRIATKAYIEKHPEETRARVKIYRERTKPIAKAYAFEYRLLHGDELRAKRRQWDKEHPEEVRDRAARSYQKNKVAQRPKRAEARRRRYARQIHAPVVERIDSELIYKRDKGICSICHTYVKLSDSSIDHVVPLSKGGEHSNRNCVLAHRRCNSKKGNRGATQQQRLF